MTAQFLPYVEPPISETRVHRLWCRVSARLDARKRRLWLWLLVGGTLCSVAAVVLLIGKLLPSREISPDGRPVAAAKLVTARDPVTVTLVDGSKVSLASHTEVHVHGNQQDSPGLSLVLTQGEVVCDVVHREGRAFTVVTNDVEVRVVGTRFSVTATPGEAQRVEVSVLRGAVEVVNRSRPGVVARISAGQSWVQSPPRSPASASSAGGGGRRSVDASAQLHGAPPPDSSGVASPIRVPPLSARELFAKAGESRRSDDAAAAAHAYEELLRLHPSDGRAGLSAFELGRLRMDRLGDPAGAISALERALALNIGPSFREDALARLVSVYATQGDDASCSHARNRYLSSYPYGVHAITVASRCDVH